MLILGFYESKRTEAYLSAKGSERNYSSTPQTACRPEVLIKFRITGSASHLSKTEDFTAGACGYADPENEE